MGRVTGSAARTSAGTRGGPDGDRPAPQRARDRVATQRRILAEAVRLFAEHGYTQVTVRAIAAAADVNVALIARYYGSKLGLFDAVLSVGSEPADLTDVSLDELPARLAEYTLGYWSADADPALVAATRSVEVPEVRDLLRARLTRTLIEPLAGRLPGPRARSKATLCAAVLVGTGSVRRLLEGHTPADAELRARLTEIFRTCLA